MSSLHYIIIRQDEYKVYVRDAQILNLTRPWIHLLDFTHTIIWWPHTATDKKCTKRHKEEKITRCSQVISRSMRGARAFFRNSTHRGEELYPKAFTSVNIHTPNDKNADRFRPGLLQGVAEKNTHDTHCYYHAKQKKIGNAIKRARKK